MLRFGDKGIRRRIERDGRFAQKLMTVRKDGAVLGFAAVGVKDTQAGRGGKQKVDTLEEVHASVVERGGGVADCGFRGKLAGADNQPHEVGDFGVHQKCAIVAGDHPVWALAKVVVTLFIRDLEAEFGKCAARSWVVSPL